MAEELSEEELSVAANFVFKGTVQKLKAATMPEVPVTARTAVVRVDEIIESPATMTDFAGSEITVELGGKKRIKEGEQAVFYANGWIFGEGLAVRSIEHRPVAAAADTLAVAGVSPGNPVENLANKQARLRFESSSVVVSGRVTSVRLPPPPLAVIGVMGAAAAGPVMDEPENRPISEHDPLMQEAVVEVETVHKGMLADSETTILFPSSTDVQWYSAPKFRPGQQGFFMLHKEEKKGVKPEGLATAAAMGSVVMDEEIPGGTFMALHPADFQFLDQPGGVRNLIQDVPVLADESGD